MERRPEDLVDDPHLRPDFVVQISWDEWAAEHTPFFLHPMGRVLVERGLQEQGLGATYEDAIEVAKEEWRRSLHPETNITEVLYLLGFTLAERQHITEQMHAELLQRAVEAGIIEERQSDKDFREEFGD